MVVGFAIVAAWELVTAAGVVAFRKPMYNALSLVANMLGLAVLFLMLNAQFLFAAQIIVYAGAVMVLFVFIIALMNPEADISFRPRGTEWIYGVVFGVIFAALLGGLLFNRGLTGRPGTSRLCRVLTALLFFVSSDSTERLDDELDVLRPRSRTDEKSVLGVDDDHVLETDRGDEPAVPQHDAAPRVDQYRFAEKAARARLEFFRLGRRISS